MELTFCVTKINLNFIFDIFQSIEELAARLKFSNYHLKKTKKFLNITGYVT